MVQKFQLLLPSKVGNRPTACVVASASTTKGVSIAIIGTMMATTRAVAVAVAIQAVAITHADTGRVVARLKMTGDATAIVTVVTTVTPGGRLVIATAALIVIKGKTDGTLLVASPVPVPRNASTTAPGKVMIDAGTSEHETTGAQVTVGHGSVARRLVAVVPVAAIPQ